MPDTPSVSAQDPQAVQTTLVTVPADGSFDDTVDALQQAVSDNEMMVLGDIDQAGALSATGLDLAGAHSFFVGNPSAGKMFFERTPAIGTVIPLRMHVWADNDGTAHVSYFDPKPLFEAVDPELDRTVTAVRTRTPSCPALLRWVGYLGYKSAPSCPATGT